MVSLSAKVAVLRKLGRKMSFDRLTQVQPMVLLQVAIGLSQMVNGGAARPDQMARALILDGQQRLRALRRAAPHLDLSLARLVGSICSDGSPEERVSEEESAVQAVLEMCVGFLLRWLSGRDGASRRTASSLVGKPSLDASILVFGRTSSLFPLSRARSCLIS